MLVWCRSFRRGDALKRVGARIVRRNSLRGPSQVEFRLDDRQCLDQMADVPPRCAAARCQAQSLGATRYGRVIDWLIDPEIPEKPIPPPRGPDSPTAWTSSR